MSFKMTQILIYYSLLLILRCYLMIMRPNDKKMKAAIRKDAGGPGQLVRPGPVAAAADISAVPAPPAGAPTLASAPTDVITTKSYKYQNDFFNGLWFKMPSWLFGCVSEILWDILWGQIHLSKCLTSSIQELEFKYVNGQWSCYEFIKIFLFFIFIYFHLFFYLESSMYKRVGLSRPAPDSSPGHQAPPPAVRGPEPRYWCHL